MRTHARLAVLVSLCALFGVARAESDEDKLKAEFLIRFAGFTTWPSTAFDGNSAPVVVGVWSDGDFTKTLSAVIGTRTAGGRKIVARTIRGTSDIRSVHILYVPASGARSMDRVLSEASRRPVLTVSEVSGFCKRGGVLNFYRDGEYIRFEANPDAARSAGLQVSSQLLRLARIVRG